MTFVYQNIYFHGPIPSIPSSTAAGFIRSRIGMKFKLQGCLVIDSKEGSTEDGDPCETLCHSLDEVVVDNCWHIYIHILNPWKEIGNMKLLSILSFFSFLIVFFSLSPSLSLCLCFFPHIYLSLWQGMYLNLKCFTQRRENRASSRARFWKQGSGRGVITFMLTCVTCTCYRLGWDVNVHVNLRHTHMLRHVGWVGGDVNVHVNLRHMHMLRHVTGLGGVYVHVYNLNLCHMHMLRVGEGLSVHVNLRLMHMLRHVTGLVGC